MKQIIIALSWIVEVIYEDPTREFHWNAFPVEDYLRSQHTISVGRKTSQDVNRHNGFLTGQETFKAI